LDRGGQDRREEEDRTGGKRRTGQEGRGGQDRRVEEDRTGGKRRGKDNIY
jgi:hypothetical protein